MKPNKFRRPYGEWYSSKNPPKGKYYWHVEQHQRNCTCSYCRGTYGCPSRMPIGLKRPQDPGGWSVFTIPLLRSRLYIRWTRVKK